VQSGSFTLCTLYGYLEKKRFPDGTTTLILMFNKPKTVRLAYTFSYTYLEISEVLEEDVQASTTGSYPERE